MTQTETPATPRQAEYIKGLLSERTDFTEGFRARVLYGLSTGELDKVKASEIITWLLAKPRAAKVTTATTPPTAVIVIDDPMPAAPTAAALPDVPAGYYAVASATGHNDLDFFRIDRPTEGKWAGRTFVKRVVGGHSDMAIPFRLVPDILDRIVAAGIDKSNKLYADEIGRCFRCNRHLTDEISREHGMGPHCRSF